MVDSIIPVAWTCQTQNGGSYYRPTFQRQTSQNHMVWNEILVHTPRLRTRYCLAMVRQFTFVFTLWINVMWLFLPWPPNACQLVHITVPHWPKTPPSSIADRPYLLVKSSFYHAPCMVKTMVKRSQWYLSLWPYDCKKASIMMQIDAAICRSGCKCPGFVIICWRRLA